MDTIDQCNVAQAYRGDSTSREMTLDEMLAAIDTRINVAEEGLRSLREAAMSLRDRLARAVRRKANGLRAELAELEPFEKR